MLVQIRIPVRKWTLGAFILPEFRGYILIINEFLDLFKIAWKSSVLAELPFCVLRF